MTGLQPLPANDFPGLGFLRAASQNCNDYKNLRRADPGPPCVKLDRMSTHVDAFVQGAHLHVSRAQAYLELELWEQAKEDRIKRHPGCSVVEQTQRQKHGVRLTEQMRRIETDKDQLSRPIVTKTFTIMFSAWLRGRQRSNAL